MSSAEASTRDNPTHVVFLITAPIAEAPGLARQLVDERLCACCSIIPAVQSIYRWEGQICDEHEALLVAKTRADLAAAFTRRAVALHSYDVPEVIGLPLTAGNAPYLAWVTRETGEGPHGTGAGETK